jgi:hypothetical protein
MAECLGVLNDDIGLIFGLSVGFGDATTAATETANQRLRFGIKESTTLDSPSRREINSISKSPSI